MIQKKPLNVEVKGISFNNQGACLMLFAIIEEFERRGVAANFLIEYSGTSIKEFPHRLWRKARYVRKGTNLLAPLSLIPSALLKPFNLKKCIDVDVVLDVSGFSYGDQWNWRVARDRLSSTIEEFKLRNVPVILLPQALGPFENVDGRAEFFKIAKHADLIFARDEQSLEYASPLTPSEKLFLAPDFTPTVSYPSGTEFDQFLNRACIVPNSKMLTKNTASAAAYVKFLEHAIKRCSSMGLSPFILLHELKEDNSLIHDYIQSKQLDIEVVAPADVRVCKAIISKARLLICSRFHGVVSGLSLSIPTICAGWSHKYFALMQYYRCEDFLVETGDLTALDEKLTQLEQHENYAAHKQKLSECAARHKHAIPPMWDRVFDVIAETESCKNLV